MTARIPLTILYALLFATPLFAQEEKILLPIALRDAVPGALGSRWESRMTVLNSGTGPVAIEGLVAPCPFDPCVPGALRPGITVALAPHNPSTIPGKLLRVDRARAGDVHISLRIQDVSRQSETWGTELPVVRESQAHTGRIEILDVPADSRFRSHLRVYDFDPAPGRSVRVRIFEIHRTRATADALLDEFMLTFRVPEDPAANPGYADVLLGAGAGLAGTSTLRVEIEPLTPGLRYWAFASVTNNLTQHVTTVEPR